MSTAIRFDNDGTTVDLLWDEVHRLEMKSTRKSDFHQFAYNGSNEFNIDSPYQGTFGMYFTSKRYREFTIDVFLQYKTTLAKIQTMRNWVDSFYQPKPFKLYYEYIISTSNHYWVQFVRETYKEQYQAGHPDQYLLKLRFVESRADVVPAIIYKPDDLVGSG